MTFGSTADVYFCVLSICVVKVTHEISRTMKVEALRGSLTSHSGSS